MTMPEIVEHVSPYLYGVARRAAFRCRMTPRELFHEFVLYTLANAHEFDTGADPIGYVYWFCKRVIEQHSGSRRRRVRRSVPLDEAPASILARETDPSGPAELADDLARLRERLATLSTRRRGAIELRFGLGTGTPIVGPDLATALGVRRGSTAMDYVRDGLEELAVLFDADPTTARVSKREGGTLGQIRKRRDEAKG